MKLKEIINPTIPNTNFFSRFPTYVGGNPERALEFYIYNHSGEKEASRILEIYHKNGTDIALVVGSFLNTMFGIKWSKLLDTIRNEIDFMSNEDREHINTPNITKEFTHGHKKTETPNITNETNTDRSYKNSETLVDGSTDGIYGFNSDTSVGSSDKSGFETRISAGNADDNKTHTIDTETGTREFVDSGTDVDTRTGKETDTYKGRNGDFTVGRIFEDAITSFKYMDYLKQIFKDIDTVLTKPMYIY